MEARLPPKERRCPVSATKTPLHNTLSAPENAVLARYGENERISLCNQLHSNSSTLKPCTYTFVRVAYAHVLMCKGHYMCMCTYVCVCAHVCACARARMCARHARRSRSLRRRGLHFQVLKVSQSTLKCPCFLFPPFFFAESWNHSLKLIFRPDLHLQQSVGRLHTLLPEQRCAASCLRLVVVVVLLQLIGC